MATTTSTGILDEERTAEREELVEMLTTAYWMEIETVMNYITNSVNPDGVRAQIEGAIMDGIATVFGLEITLREGRIEQSNFDRYRWPTMSGAPEIDIHIVPSPEPPGGAGEPPYPSVAPAITNAIFNAVGVRVRKLPISGSLA